MELRAGQGATRERVGTRDRGATPPCDANPRPDDRINLFAALPATVAFAAAACGPPSPAGDTRPAPAADPAPTTGEAELALGTCFHVDLRDGRGGFRAYHRERPDTGDPAGGIGSDEPDEVIAGENAACRSPFAPQPLAAVNDEMAACVAAAEAPTGRLAMEILAARDGEVVSARAMPPVGPADPALAGCLARALRFARFPPADGGASPLHRPIVCTARARSAAPTPAPSVVIALDGDTVHVDGEPVVDVTRLTGADAPEALSVLSHAVPPEHLVPEATWSVEIRAPADLDLAVVEGVVRYLDPTVVYYARRVGTSDAWVIVNPLGSPGWRFCSVAADHASARIVLGGEGRAGARVPEGTTDLAVTAGAGAIYRDLLAALEDATRAGAWDVYFAAGDSSDPAMEGAKDAGDDR